MKERFSFKTIIKPFVGEEIKIKNSKFISHIFPIDSIDDFKSIHSELKKRYHDSTHICFALRLLENNEEYFRYNDDGEPSGTAGLPILNEIRRKELFFVALFVIRYYGGIKLGTGGLLRAYSESARNVIDCARIIEKEIYKKITLEFDYDKTGVIMSIINREKLKILKNDYSNNKNIIELNIPLSKYESLSEVFINSTSGSVRIK